MWVKISDQCWITMETSGTTCAMLAKKSDELPATGQQPRDIDFGGKIVQAAMSGIPQSRSLVPYSQDREKLDRQDCTVCCILYSITTLTIYCTVLYCTVCCILNSLYCTYAVYCTLLLLLLFTFQYYK